MSGTGRHPPRDPQGTFNYMVETVRDYDRPGELALTEQAVADYVALGKQQQRSAGHPLL